MMAFCVYNINIMITSNNSYFLEAERVILIINFLASSLLSCKEPVLFTSEDLVELWPQLF